MNYMTQDCRLYNKLMMCRPDSFCKMNVTTDECANFNGRKNEEMLFTKRREASTRISKIDSGESQETNSM